ncbi:MAG: CheF family chemotaxis protein [Haloarculaceae archaeon]
MTESVIADFVAAFNAENTRQDGPTKGRVLLSQKRLVLAANDESRATIPLSAVFDIVVGHVPSDLGDFFDATVTIAFERNNNRYAAAIEAGEETIEKFSTVLFKAILNGTDMTVNHPARVGGRVTDQEFVPAKLSLKPKAVRFTRGDSPLVIRLSTITDFSRSNRDIAGSRRPVLQIRHMDSGQSTMTMAATDSSRKMSILGRYLRLEYSDLMADLEDIEISNDEKQILVAIYSGAGSEGISLPTIVDKNPQEVMMLLNRLQDADLVIDTGEGTRLTPKGQVVVNNHLEDVND